MVCVVLTHLDVAVEEVLGLATERPIALVDELQIGRGPRRRAAFRIVPV